MEQIGALEILFTRVGMSDVSIIFLVHVWITVCMRYRPSMLWLIWICFQQSRQRREWRAV
jgi:hypothetical protein